MIYKIMPGFVSFIRDARSSAFELSLQKLGIEKLTKDNMQQLVDSNMNIGTWTQIMQITVRMLLKL